MVEEEVGERYVHKNNNKKKKRDIIVITLEKTTEKRGERGHDKLPVIDGDPRQRGEGGREEGPKDGKNNQKKEVSIRRANSLSTLPQYVSAQFSNYLGNLLLLLSMSQQTTKDEEKKTTM